jgi:hypothetical protein
LFPMMYHRIGHVPAEMAYGCGNVGACDVRAFEQLSNKIGKREQLLVRRLLGLHVGDYLGRRRFSYIYGRGNPELLDDLGDMPVLT